MDKGWRDKLAVTPFNIPALTSALHSMPLTLRWTAAVYPCVIICVPFQMRAIAFSNNKITYAGKKVSFVIVMCPEMHNQSTITDYDPHFL